MGDVAPLAGQPALAEAGGRLAAGLCGGLDGALPGWLCTFPLVNDIAIGIAMMLHFGIFHLLGYQFSPRIADIGGARFWRVDPRADYGVLDALAAKKVNVRLIAEHWDDLLRLAGSLKLGVVRAAGLTRTLQTNDRPTKLARALQELGRLALYALRDLLDDRRDFHHRRRIRHPRQPAARR